jgi:hypothetical protein
MGLHDLPAAWHGKISLSIVTQDTGNFPQMHDLVGPTSDMLDDMVGYDRIEGFVLEWQQDAIDKLESVSIPHNSLVDNVNGVHHSFLAEFLRKRIRDHSRPGAYLQYPERAVLRDNQIQQTKYLLRLGYSSRGIQCCMWMTDNVIHRAGTSTP